MVITVTLQSSVKSLKTLEKGIIWVEILNILNKKILLIINLIQQEVNDILHHEIEDIIQDNTDKIIIDKSDTSDYHIHDKIKDGINESEL